MQCRRWATTIGVTMLTVAVGVAPTAVGAPLSINLQLVRSTIFFMGSTMDPSTGKFYTGNGFQNDGFVRVYDSAADYEADTSSGFIQLQGEGFFGTYFAVRNGKLYGRAGVVKNHFGWPTDSSVARWDAVTGTRELDVASIPNMGGINGPHTFNWGGYSAVNWMQDGGDLYVVGADLAGNIWQVNRMDAALGIVQTVTFNAGQVGYGFIIGGHLFTGDSYNSNHISNRIDLSTGTQTPVDINLTGFGELFVSNAFYDPNADALYVFSAGDIFKVPNASDAFGVVTTLDVGIDIKPGSDPNSINLKSKGNIPVAILTTSIADGDTQDFDATTVDPLSVAFAGASVAHPHEVSGHIEDVDDDGDDDVVLHFRTQEVLFHPTSNPDGIECGDTQATLIGETNSGEQIEGTDSIRTVGCK